MAGLRLGCTRRESDYPEGFRLHGAYCHRDVTEDPDIVGQRPLAVRLDWRLGESGRSEPDH